MKSYVDDSIYKGIPMRHSDTQTGDVKTGRIQMENYHHRVFRIIWK